MIGPRGRSGEMGPVAAWLSGAATVALAVAIAVGLTAGGFSPALTVPTAGAPALALCAGLVIGSRRLAAAALVFGGGAAAMGVALGAPMAAVAAGAALLLAGEASAEALLRRGRARLDRATSGRLIGRTAFVWGVSVVVATLLAMTDTPARGRSVLLETAAVGLAVGLIATAAVVAHRRLRPPAGDTAVS